MDSVNVGGLYLDVGIDYAALAQSLGLSESVVAASAEKLAGSYVKAFQTIHANSALIDVFPKLESDLKNATTAVGVLGGAFKELEEQRLAARFAEKAMNDAVKEGVAQRLAIEKDANLRRKELQDVMNGDMLAAQRVADEAMLAEQVALKQRIAAALRPEHGPENRPVAAPGVELAALGTSIGTIGSKLQQLGTVTTFALTVPIGIAVKQMLQYAGLIEQAQTSLGRLLGSQNLASNMIAQLREFSLTTPFEFKGSLEAFRRITEMGFAAKNALPIMRTLGDQVAALGGDTTMLNNLVSVIGKIQQQRYVSGIELRAFRSAAIPAQEFLMEGLNMNGEEFAKAIKTHAIKAAEAIPIILAGMRVRSEGEMETMSNTMLGIWTNVKEKVQFALADIGTAFVPLAKRALNWSFNALDGATRMADAFAKLPPGIQNTTLGMVAFLAALGPAEFLIGGMVKGLGGIFSVLGQLEKLAAGRGLLTFVGGAAGAMSGLAIAALAVGAAFVGWELGGVLVRLYDFGKRIIEIVDKENTWINQLKDIGVKLRDIADMVIPPKIITIVQKLIKAESFLAHRALEAAGPFGGMNAMLDIADGLDADNIFSKGRAKNAARPNKGANSFDLEYNAKTGQFSSAALANTNSTVTQLRHDSMVDETNNDSATNDSAIKKAFSELGLKDAKKDLADINAAFALIGGSLSDMQRGQAIGAIEKALFAARQEGILTQEVFDKLFDTNRNKLANATQERGANGPALFEIPDSLKGTFGSVQEYNKILADFKNKQDEATAATLKRTIAEKAYSAELNERDLQNAGAGDISSKVGISVAAEDAVYRALEDQNSAINKGINALSEHKGKIDENIVVNQIWTTVVKAGLKPMEDADKAMQAFGIKNYGAELSRMTAAWPELVKAQELGLVSTMDMKRAWVAMAEAQVASGQKLSAESEKRYNQLKREVDAVSNLKQSWRDFSGQVSTIFNDFGRGVLDIILPKTPKAPDPTGGVPSNIASSFKSAFDGLANSGIADPRKALDEIIAKIKSAGSVADANAIALRHFGDQGPTIARLLRDGSISADQLAKTLNIATDSMNKNTTASEKGLSKITLLWREVERSIGRALIETGAKAISRFVAVEMKSLIHSLEEYLAKLPIVGAALAKVFGIKTASSAANIGAGELSGVINGTGLGGPAPLGLPSAPGPISFPSGASTGAAGVGGQAASTALQSVTSVITAATSVMTAISSIVGNFQFAHMNTALGRIEESTRKSWIVTGEQGAESIQGILKQSQGILYMLHDRLIGVRDALFDPVAQGLDRIQDLLKGGNITINATTTDGTGVTNNFYIDSSIATGTNNAEAAIDIVRASQRLLRAQGVLSRHDYNPDLGLA